MDLKFYLLNQRLFIEVKQTFLMSLMIMTLAIFVISQPFKWPFLLFCLSRRCNRYKWIHHHAEYTPHWHSKG